MVFAASCAMPIRLQTKWRVQFVECIVSSVLLFTSITGTFSQHTLSVFGMIRM
jgi:hypothetical protein